MFVIIFAIVWDLPVPGGPIIIVLLSNAEKIAFSCEKSVWQILKILFWSIIFSTYFVSSIFNKSSAEKLINGSGNLLFSFKSKTAFLNELPIGLQINKLSPGHLRYSEFLTSSVFKRLNGSKTDSVSCFKMYLK